MKPCLHQFAMLTCLAVVASVASVRADVVIAAYTNAVSSSYPNPVIDKVYMINGAGLSDKTIVETGDPIPTTWPSHSHDHYNVNWHSDQYDVKAVITFDLGAQCELTGFHLWNHNQMNYTDRGIRNLDIYVSLDANNWYLHATLSDIAQAPGQDSYRGSDYTIALTTARYVRFNVLTNWGSTYTGISEIRFIGTVLIPEPASAVLAVSGMAGLMLTARRRI